MPRHRETARPARVALGADPVRELMVDQRELCEQATHPLEIAAGLEEAGISAATAGRYRHADVFSLAEELFARLPRRPADRPTVDAGADAQPPEAPPGPGFRIGSGLALLGALLLPLVTVLGGGPSLGAAGALALAAWPAAAAADWTARWVRHAGRVQLRTAASIAEFRARMRPVLPVALGLQLAAFALAGFAALAVLAAASPRPGAAASGGLLHAVVQRAGPAQWAGQAALGLLLGSAAVLRRCGGRALALTGLLTADGLGAGLTALRSGGLLPGWTAAPGVLTALAAGAGSALLLPYAWAMLGRPGAHR